METKIKSNIKQKTKEPKIHQLRWFESRVGKQIYKRCRVTVNLFKSEIQRVYLTIESLQHAKGLYVSQFENQKINYYE